MTLGGGTTARDVERERLARVASGVALASGEAHWRARIDRIAEVLFRELAARTVQIYGLHLSDGNFHLETATDPASDEIYEPSAEVLAGVPVVAGSNLVLPIMRNQNCVMIVRLNNFRYIGALPLLQQILQPLAAIHLDRRSGRVLAELRTTFDYRQTVIEFHAALGQAVLAASGMQFAALRVIKGDFLDCVAAWGFTRSIRLDNLSWSTHRFEEFEKAAQGHPIANPDLQSLSSSGLANVPELSNVRAFVAMPVNIGAERFGVLSLATSTNYVFASTELTAFQSLANVIGMILGNYHSVMGNSPTAPELNEFSLKATIDWIAHDARHVASARLDNARQQLGRIKKLDPAFRAAPDVIRLSGMLDNLAVVFDRYGMAVRSPSYEWTVEPIENIWKQALFQFSSQIESLEIKVSPAPAITLGTYPQWMRAALGQLVMNSIDAFNKKGFGLGPPASKSREISLVLDEVATTVDTAVLRYTDNAGGINPAMIAAPNPEVQSMPLKEKIFRPETSSKRGSSTGWGLPLVRAAIREVHGDIELIDNSVRGVTFAIAIPRASARR